MRVPGRARDRVAEDVERPDAGSKAELALFALGLDFVVLHDRAPLYVTLSDGSLRNGYTVKLLNKTREERRLYLTIEGIPQATMFMAGEGDELTSLRLDTGEACLVERGECAPHEGLRPAARARVDALIARWGSERWRSHRAQAAD